MQHPSTIARPEDACPKGRPVHAAITAFDALLEAVVAIENDEEALAHITHANVALAKQAQMRATRLRERVIPELQIGLFAAEKWIAERAA